MKVKNIGFGFIIGATMLVPGVSGGSVAVLLGIYDKMLESVATLHKKFWKNIQFLGSIALGGLVGFMLVSKTARFLIEKYYAPSMYFFIGIVLSGMFYQTKNIMKRFDGLNTVSMFLGTIFVLMLKYFPFELSAFSQGSVGIQLFIFLLFGILLAIALILPGVSFSLMLVTIGGYDRFLEAVNGMDLSFLLPLGSSILFGVAIFSGILDKMLKRYPQQSHSMILGFVVASVLQMYPGIVFGTSGIICLLLFLMGILLPVCAVRFFRLKK